jgi:hypothetical protein
LARTLKNLAPGSSYQLSVGGVASISSGYVTVGPTAFFVTTIPESADFTMITLALPLTGPAAITTFGQSSLVDSISTATSPATTVSCFVPHDTGSQSNANLGTLTLGAGFTTMRVISFGFRDSDKTARLRDVTNNTTASPVTFTGSRVSDATRKFSVGGRSLSAGTARVGFAAIYNRFLTTAEEDSIRTFVATYRLAKYGDVV